MLKFGDYLSNALHDIKRFSGKKISVVMDELGYGFEPELSGDTIESWRYRKAPPTLAHLETLARLIIAYKTPQHDQEWLDAFLKSAEHPYPQALANELFPDEDAPAETEVATHPVQPIPLANPPSLKAYSPPVQSGFVGRTAEIAHYTHQLKNQSVAVISGMAGVGKTSLMSTISSQYGSQPVFWHSFAHGTAESIALRLAGFVANLGQPDLWEMFESARLTGGRPPEFSMSLDMLSVVLGELSDGVLICLDDLQFVDEDARLEEFVRKLLPLESVKLLITTRRYPSYLPTEQKAQLKGLSNAETADLLASRDVSLAQDLTVRLTELTAGNGAFLTLASVILKNSRNPEAVIGQLAREDDIERFLMEEVNDRLEGGEQRVMEAVAILSGYPGTRDVLEAILNMRDVRRLLRGLADQYLILVDENDTGDRVYQQHQIIQTFYYEQPRKSKRKEMHGRAADFYEFEEPEPFKAMLHHGKAGQNSAVMLLASQHFYDVVNSGDGRALTTILDQVDMMSSTLSQTDIVQFLLARGRLSLILGDLEPAEADLQEAAEMLQFLPSNDESDTLKANVCLAMANLFERQEPPKALIWVQRGLELAPNDQLRLNAELKSLAGVLNFHLGNLGESQEFLMDALETIPEGASHLRMTTLRNLGSLFGKMGQQSRARDLNQQAFELSVGLKDYNLQTSILLGFGPVKYQSGDWAGAIKDLTQGLKLSQQLGNRELTASTMLNLGSCHLTAGNDELAERHLSQGLNLLKDSEIHIRQVALNRLAQLSLYQQTYDRGLKLLEECEALCQISKDQNSLTFIYSIRAELFLGKGEIKSGKEWAEKAVKHSLSLGDRYSTGMAYIALGRCLKREKEFEAAEKTFKQAMTYFEDESPHDTAIVQMELGHTKALLGEKIDAQVYLEHAHSTFEFLGANRQLAQISSYQTTFG